MADTDTGTDQAAKAKGDKAKGAKAKSAGKQKAKAKRPGGAGGDALAMSVANHPRAGAQVGRAKAWGGLAGFALVAVLSWQAHVPMPDLLLRAIAGGTAAYVVAWAGAVVIWRHLVVAELRAVRVQRAVAMAKLARVAPVDSGATRPPGA